MTDLSTNPRADSLHVRPPATSYQEVQTTPLAPSTSASADRGPDPLVAFPTNATSVTTSRWAGYVSRRIGELARREYDFTGLTPPSQANLEEAWHLANYLFRFDTATPSVVPSEDGSVVFVWHKAGWDVEIEVAQGERFVWARERSSGTGFSGPLQEHYENLSKLLVSLSGL